MKPLSFNQPPVVPAVENKKSLAEEFTEKEIKNGLAIPEKNITIGDNIKLDTLNSSETSGFPFTFKKEILTADLSLLQQESGSLNNIGSIFLCFGEEIKGNKLLFIASRLLKKQKDGFGLDLECQIEIFCKKHGINFIYNKASSRDKKNGAYVWARYGYEFADERQIESLRTSFYYFALKKGVIIIPFLENLKRPIDFALAKGVPKEGGEKVDIGKIFLLSNNSEWHGKRDLTPGSQGTKDFIAYLKERGREDLIDKYYADEK